jgi:uncharacterized membrane protein YebE (DUF533 family)
MAKKEPMRLSQDFKDNIQGNAGVGAIMVGGSMANTVPGMIIGGLAGAALGAIGGVAQTAYQAHKARKAQARADLVRSISHHPALGRQWPKD